MLWVQHGDDELVVGSPAWQWVSALVPAEGEPRLQKQHNSSFEQTGLEQALAVNPDDVPNNRLATLIAQKRARILQSRVDELFTDAAAHYAAAPRLAVAPPVPHTPVPLTFR